MRSVYSVAEIRTAEARVLSRTPADELMLRAATALGRSCIELLTTTRGLVYGASVVLLVGGGNNGGDALYAGAHLSRRGASVTAVLTTDRVHDGGLTAFRRAGGLVLDVGKPAHQQIADAELVVDGMVGTGGQGALRGPGADLAEHATEGPAMVVAVDLPSGVDADTGRTDGDAIWADVTVTFGALKPGLLLAPGAEHAGVIEVVDIGLRDDLMPARVGVLDITDVARLQPHPVPSDHKYSQGVVGVAAGSALYPGAALLTTGAALVTKPGLVRYSGEVADRVVAQWPSAIVSTSSPREVGRVQAWAVGPGLGTGAHAEKVLAEVLDENLPTVVDADALTLAAGDPKRISNRSAPTVLTPHDGEFSRLAPDLDLAHDRVAAVRELAKRFTATVLLKGSTTVIADELGTVRLNPTGTPYLATAGTGDVLTGMIGAYLAAGLPPVEAAATAAFVHGLAGRLASSGAPCLSTDVLEAIPAAVREITAP